MKIYVAIDDTDSLEVGSTGQLANELRSLIMERGWGKTEAVTRHQLLIHPDIPYTSHNSAMCFIADVSEEKLPELIECAGEFLKTSSAPGSDPGLCIAVNDRIMDINRLMKFGLKAKTEILNKEEAWRTAQLCRIHLSEHGGTGQGIIGALAGIALRITGNDGRFQGKEKLGEPGRRLTVGTIIANTPVEEVQSLDGQVLTADEVLIIGEKTKTVLLEGKRKLLAYCLDNEWHSCNNQQLKKY